MIRKATTPLIVLMVLVIILPFFYFFSFSLSVARETVQPVNYELPYPGILSNNPFYGLKVLRDKLMEFTTRDNLKKASLHILISDKKMRAAELLQQNGSVEKVVPELESSQQYFKKAVQNILLSKQQGVSASAELVKKMKLSNLKHREVMLRLKGAASTTDEKEIEAVLFENGLLREALRSM